MPVFLRRNPTAYVALLEAVLVLAVSWGMFGVTEERLPLIMAVASGGLGVVTAIYTKRAGFAVAIGLVKATIALTAGYGLVLTDNQTTGIIGFTVVVLGFFNWTATEPADNPGLHEEAPTVVEGTVVTNNLAISHADADMIADHVRNELAKGAQSGGF